MTTKYGCKNAFNFFFCLFNHGLSFLMTEEDISEFRKEYEAKHPYPTMPDYVSGESTSSKYTRMNIFTSRIRIGDDYDEIDDNATTTFVTTMIGHIMSVGSTSRANANGTNQVPNHLAQSTSPTFSNQSEYNEGNRSENLRVVGSTEGAANETKGNVSQLATAVQKDQITPSNITSSRVIATDEVGPETNYSNSINSSDKYSLRPRNLAKIHSAMIEKNGSDISSAMKSGIIADNVSERKNETSNKFDSVMSHKFGGLTGVRMDNVTGNGSIPVYNNNETILMPKENTNIKSDNQSNQLRANHQGSAEMNFGSNYTFFNSTVGSNISEPIPSNISSESQNLTFSTIKNNTEDNTHGRYRRMKDHDSSLRTNLANVPTADVGRHIPLLSWFLRGFRDFNGTIARNIYSGGDIPKYFNGSELMDVNEYLHTPQKYIEKVNHDAANIKE